MEATYGKERPVEAGPGFKIWSRHKDVILISSFEHSYNISLVEGFMSHRSLGSDGGDWISKILVYRWAATLFAFFWHDVWLGGNTL